ncbi:hypothetical protein [Nocardioides alkalitolerans]|uniref:hypothetical protein n=1 Tax=Nocardioides alkalitolerans TaxID=281714 RepID=UPI0003FF580E|nr:hypothetical protein [Nocardioides alkalitolerans]
MQRSAARLVAALSTVAVVGVITAPGAVAAEPAAEASATAAILTIAGSPVDSGQYTVVNDGTTETATGQKDPAVADLLSNQSNVSIGVLYQDATTAVTGGRGTAYACSGVAGTGAVVVEVGDGSCLTGGDAVSLVPGTIDLGDTTVIESEILAPLTVPLQQALGEPLASQVLAPLSDVLNQVLGGLGELGVVLETTGAIQSTCTANSTSASADSNVAGLRGYVTVAGQDITILDLPVGDLEPNTELTADLNDVVNAVLNGLQTQLQNGLNGALGPLGLLLAQIQDVTNLLVPELTTALEPLLGPLRDNVLEVTLNKQSQPSPSSIEVTALDVQVLPAAQQFLSSSLASVELGKAFCAGGVADVAQPPPATEPPTVTPPVNNPTVPISVPAGMSGEEGSAPWGPVALGAMTLLAGLVGGYRFLQLRRS